MLEFNRDIPKMNRCPEIEILLCCAGKSIEADRAERIRSLLLQGIDWVYLIRLAISNGFLSFLYNGLNQTCPGLVPQVTLAQLRRQYESNLERCLYMSRELTGLLKLLYQHGICGVPFKGPVLAVSVYGSLSLRQFSDLDILVCKRDVPAAMSLLISQGYKLKLAAGLNEGATGLTPENVYQFLRDDGKVVVELHWGLVPEYYSFPLELESYLGRLQQVSLEGADVLTFSPQDLLLILCMHGCKHRWERLDWICDIAELVRSRGDIDWAEVVKRARAQGIERVLYVGLLVAKELFQVPLPGEVSERIERMPVVKRLAAESYKCFHCDGDTPGFLETPLTVEGILIGAVYFHLRMRERLRDKFKYCLHLLHLALKPTPCDRLAVPLPVYFSFLYYVLRPLRLVNQYGLSRLKRLSVGSSADSITRSGF